MQVAEGRPVKRAGVHRSGGTATRTVLLALGLGIASMGPVDVAAQGPGQATIAGTVRTSAGSQVARVLVTLEDPTGQILREVRSNAWGEYAFDLLEPGAYRLRLEQVGHHPVRVDGLELGPGAVVSLDLTLEPTEGAAARTRVVRVRPAPAVGAPTDLALMHAAPPLLPTPAGPVEDAIPLSPAATAVSVEGLPLSWLGASFGGRSAGAFAGPGTGAAARLVPLALVRSSQPIGGADVEWEAPAGVALDLRPREWRGPQALVVAGAADALYGDDPAPAGTEIFTSAAYGPPQGPTAGVRGAVAWQRRSTGGILAAELDDRFAAARGAAGARGVAMDATEPEADLVALTGDMTTRTGRRSWLRVGGVFAGAIGASTPGPLDTGFEAGAHLGGLVRAEHMARPAAAEGLGLETRADYSWDRTDADDRPGPETLLADGPVHLARARPEESWNAWTLSQSAYLARGAHQLKGGVWAEMLSGEVEIDPRLGPAFTFASPASLTTATGFAALLTEPAPVAEFRTTRFGGLIQDTWQLSPAVRLLVGARVFADHLPTSDIRLERSWYFATGEANTAVDRLQPGVEPRLALDWWLDERGDSRAFGSAAVHVARIDSRALAELVANDGRQTVTRWYGALGGWPLPTAAPAAGGKSLSLPGPTFAPPRTVRVEAGLSRRIAERSVIRITGTLRMTDRLLSRVDANRRGAPWGSDGFGRPVWSPLVAAGDLLGGQPDQLVQLADFDRVWRLDASAESRYAGITAEARIGTAGGAVLAGRYTFSSTRDDWTRPAFPDLGRAAPTAYVPAGAGPEGRGISDYDVPHQAVGELTLPLPVAGRPALSVLYSFRSGLPFTPVMGHGIDADGDGAANDAAYVDPQVPGIGPVLEDWACLREDAGAFVARNGCRSDPVHRVDAAATVSLIDRGSRRVSLRFEALGLVSTRTGVVDAALYRPVPGQEPVQSGATVALPLEANTSFGSVLLDLSPIRALRIGAEIAF